MVASVFVQCGECGVQRMVYCDDNKDLQCGWSRMLTVRQSSKIPSVRIVDPMGMGSLEQLNSQRKTTIVLL